jgi:hypothetical protein
MGVIRVLPPEPLTTLELRALSWALEEAAGWRGSLVGNPDTTDLEQFDLRVKIATAALKKVRRINRELRGRL